MFWLVREARMGWTAFLQASHSAKVASFPFVMWFPKNFITDLTSEAVHDLFT